MKKIINFVLLFTLLFSILPIQFAAAAPAFFIPDDTTLAGTANMSLTPASNLSRSSAKISNNEDFPITGTFQSVAASSLALTIEQITLIGGVWTTSPGKSGIASVTTSGSRFTATGATLFQGYNRLTLTGTQGSAVKRDIFYVLYDSAPMINSLQITSNNINYDLNEGASLVLSAQAAYIQGTASNVTNVTVNGQQAPVLGSGFFAPAMNLTPGLNNFDITLSNATDSITVKRQVYYYDKDNPFTGVDATQFISNAGTGTTQKYSLFNAIPTFTGQHDKATLDLQFLAPYQSAAFDNTNLLISVNAASPNVTISGTASETVITNTYGAPAYKLVKLTTNQFDLKKTAGVLDNIQPVNISMTYMPATPTAQVLTGKFQFNLAAGQNLIKNVLLLPNYTSGAAIDDNTVSQPLKGAQIKSPDFFILVDAMSPLSASDLNVSMQPLGVTALTYTQKPVVPSGTKNVGQLYLIQGLPEGAQTLAFSVQTNPVSFTAKVTYVSKNYIDLDNLYEGQIFTINSASAGSGIIPFSGKIIGFDSRLKSGSTQLIVNNIDKTSLLKISPMNVPDGSYDITAVDTSVVPAITGLEIKSSGPLFTGENTIKIIAYYTDLALPAGYLRQYVKEVKFYIVDSNTPNINDVRPLTPPSTPRVALNDPIPANYLPASPELQLANGAYTTTLSKFDLYVEGAGADDVTIKEGANVIFKANPGLYTAPAPTIYSSADFDGGRAGFKIRLNDVAIPIGTHVFTIEMTNSNGAFVSQTLTVKSQNVPYRILSPVANTGEKIIVNKNFILFDVEAIGATDVQINGASAKPRRDIANRYMYTLTGLKPDTENKITLTIKRGTGADVKDTILVTYVSNPDVGTMFMEAMGSKHSVFNKALQLSFPKGNALRRVSDGKIEPNVDLLFGIADPTNGNTELVNDYNQVLGKDIDFRTPAPTQTTIPISSSLSGQFSANLGREHFTRASDYYWISAGMGELSKVGASDYKTITGGLTPYSIEGTYTRYDDKRKVAPSERGTLTMKFDGSVVDQTSSELTVFYLGDDGLWKNIGGNVDVKANTVTVPFDKFGYYMVGKLKYSFDDVSNHDWARDILQALLAKGYMPAIYANQFGAGDYVTRGEFAGLMVRSLGMRANSDNNNTFIDIVPGSNSTTWSYEEIETAARAGIIQGLDNLIFAPDKEITRQDAAVMIARAMNVKLPINDDKLMATIQKAFADSDKINRYARPAIDALSSAKVMVGSPVITPIPTKGKQLINFNPTVNMTRAEAGQIAVRLLQKYVKGSLPANLS